MSNPDSSARSLVGSTSTQGSASTVTFTPKDPSLLMPSLLDSPVVTIYVGPERKEFKAHREVLRQRCSYFEKCFNGSFKEGQDGSVEMTEDNPEAFPYLLSWLYTQQVTELEDSILKPAAPSAQDENAVYSLYQLADKMCLNALKDILVTIMWEFFWRKKRYPNFRGLRMLQANFTHPNKMLSMVIARIPVCRKENDYYDLGTGMDEQLREFITEGGAVVSEIFAAYLHFEAIRFQGKGYTEPPLCFWHEHGPDENCRSPSAWKSEDTFDPRVSKTAKSSKSTWPTGA